MLTSTLSPPIVDFWSFYRRYTNTAIHTAAAATLAIFGILVFVDPWFAALAIASYVLPPIVLYVFDPDVVPAPEHSAETPDSNRSEPTPARHERVLTIDQETAIGGGDSDSDTDRDDGDTDSDSDGGDTDSDGDDGDTDSDSDDGDTDSDGDDGDTDSDR